MRDFFVTFLVFILLCVFAALFGIGVWLMYLHGWTKSFYTSIGACVALIGLAIYCRYLIKRHTIDGKDMPIVHVDFSEKDSDEHTFLGV